MKKKLLLFILSFVLMPQVWGMDDLTRLRAEQAEAHERKLAEQRAQEAIVAARDRASIALKELEDVQQQLKKDIIKNHSNIDLVIAHYQARGQRLPLVSAISYAVLQDRGLRDQLDERQIVLAEQDRAYDQTLTADRLKSLAEVKKLQAEEDNLLGELSKIGRLIDIDIPSRVGRLPWSVPEEEIDLPAPARKSPFGISKGTIPAIATVIVAVAAIYISERAYQRKVNRLLRKYKLQSLTSLQKLMWLAIALAYIRMPWAVQYLVKNNTGTIEDFLGADPRAAAELYYGRVPTETEVQAFLKRFFGDVK